MTAHGLRPSTRPRGWWRRNIVWLVLLPVAVVAAAGASSFRVWAYWWPVGSHHEVDRVALGEPAHLAGEYLDLGLDVPEREGTTVSRAVDATVTGIEQVAELPPSTWGDSVPVPDGAVAYAVQVRFAAEPQTDLSGCRILLLSDDGTRYGESTTDMLENVYRCLPPETDGAVSKQPEWDVTSYVFADADATITQARLAFDGPQYVTIDLP